MTEERIISSEDNTSEHSKGVLGSESIQSDEKTQDFSSLSLQDKIAKATASNGLKLMPERFDDQHGDWIIIKSKNPFEILYLDYKQYRVITPSVVTNNYNILVNFWKEKVALMNTGGNRIAFKNKFGENIVDNSLDILKQAYNKLNSEHGIENYYLEINNSRLSEGKDKLIKELKPILADNVIDTSEMEYLFGIAPDIDLTDEESAVIINDILKENHLVPKGKVSGANIKEQLLSVRWMTKDKLIEEEIKDKERENSKIKLLGKYASSIEEIGTILFEDPDGAKTFIHNNTLKNAVSQKDLDIGNEIAIICENVKNIDLAFLEVVYKLNKNLPYRFLTNSVTFDISELCSFFANDNKSIYIAKEHLKKGYVETWLKETNIDACKKLNKIRDTAANIDLAFLEFLYTFNPKLPYRFAGEILVNTPEELCSIINKNKEYWDAGRIELDNSSILVWLKTIGKSDIIEKWEKVKDQFKKNKDIGLEVFLHLLNEKIKYPKIIIDKSEILYPKVQSGDIINSEILITNETRGYVECNLSLTKNIEGVSISVSKLSFNSSAYINAFKPVLKIDTTNLIRGQEYSSEIKISTSVGQEILIPFSFKIIFPINAFIWEISKSALIFATIGILIRLLYNSIGYDGWVNEKVKYYIEIQYLDWIKGMNLGNFSLIFAAIIVFFSLIIFDRKAIRKNFNKVENLIIKIFSRQK